MFLHSLIQYVLTECLFREEEHCREKSKVNPCPHGASVPMGKTDHSQAYRVRDDATGGEKCHMDTSRWNRAQEGLDWEGGPSHGVVRTGLLPLPEQQTLVFGTFQPMRAPPTWMRCGSLFPAAALPGELSPRPEKRHLCLMS